MKPGTVLKDGNVYVAKHSTENGHIVMAPHNESLYDYIVKSNLVADDSGMKIPTIEELQVIKDNYEVLKNFRLRADTYVSSSRDHEGNSWLLGIGNCGIQTHSVSLRLVKTVTQEELESLL
jgi:hypothetical protein